VPHPLERNFLMKWKFSREVDLDTARDWILVGANQIIQHLTQLTHEWLAVCKLNVDEYTEVVEFVTANPSSDPVPVPVPEKPQRKKIDRK
jgi:hypothetical protein